jgi:hypothetical protein
VLFSASLLAQKTDVGFARGTDFSQFHTYSWQKSPQPAKGIWDQRVVEGINQQLQAKGLKEVQSDPDLWVVYASHIQEQSRVVGEGYNFGPTWGGGMWWNGPQTVTYGTFVTEEGTLIVELGNPRTHELEWRGAVTDTIHDKTNKNIKDLDKSIEKLFKDYPPKDQPKDQK